ncbi:isochorismate synthase [Crocinitomix sp.]|nr:isochorismate synthase [Crocinitomix sp.]
MKSKHIITSITYRLPNHSENSYLQGNAKWTSDWNDITNNAFIFHPFLGNEFLLIEEIKAVSTDELQFYFKDDNHQETLRTAYNASFKAIIDAISTEGFSKIILSRTKTVQHQLNALEVFDALNSNYKNTFNYIISNEEIGTWIGATPERLLMIENNKISTMSLAGTKTPSAEWSQKEFDEQAFVTDTILTEIGAFCSNIESFGPETIAAGPIEHLQTSISGQLNKVQDWAQLVKKLHPTPAVCGTPTDKAKAFIQKNEAHDRKFYTGFLGLVENQNKSFFVNLRCMEFYKDAAKLYIGGGIIKESNLEDEWLETDRKASTLVSILNPSK